MNSKQVLTKASNLAVNAKLEERKHREKIGRKNKQKKRIPSNHGCIKTVLRPCPNIQNHLNKVK